MVIIFLEKIFLIVLLEPKLLTVVRTDNKHENEKL